MKTARRSETMIALRATRTAIRIGRDVAGESLDLGPLFCTDCKVELWRNHTGEGYFFYCPNCKRITEVPPHLRDATSLLKQSRDPREVKFRSPVGYDRDDVLMPAWLKACFWLVGVGCGCMTIALIIHLILVTLRR